MKNDEEFLDIGTHCSEASQLQRLRTRNSLSLTAAQSRIASQHPQALSSKLPCADYVIDNSGLLPDLKIQVSSTIAKLHKRIGWTWVVSWLIPPFGILKGLVCIAWRRYGKGVGRERKSGGGTRGERDVELRERRKEGDGKIFGKL